MKMIVSALEMYAHEHAGTFPESLDVLTNEKYLTERFADPVTAKPYAYVLDSEGNYSVCAHFIDLTQKCLYASPKKSGM